MQLTHVGGPTVLLEVAGWRILTDPTFDLPGRRYGFGWGTSSVKTAGPALTAEAIGGVDLVLLSHDHHADNLDDRGREMIRTAPRLVTTIPGKRRLDEGVSGVLNGLRAGEKVFLEAPGLPTLGVLATPARHGPPGSRPIAGAVIGFLLWFPGVDERRIWITGDTVLFPKLRRFIRGIEIDTVILHLGGVRFPISGPLRYSMVGKDAIQLLRELRPRVAVPVHYEGWSHFAEQETELHHAMKQAPDIAKLLTWPTRGVAVTLPTL